MFFCDRCADVNGWWQSLSRSYGPCEICGVKRLCNDVPSSMLPPPTAPAKPALPLPTLIFRRLQMDDREVFEGIKTATVLKSGDRVLLTFDDRPTPDQLDWFRTILGERFPDVEFTFVAGVESVTVAPEELT